MLIKVWVLTLFLGSGGSAQYYFKTQQECLVAKDTYQRTGPNGLKSCYPSYLPVDGK